MIISCSNMGYSKYETASPTVAYYYRPPATAVFKKRNVHASLSFYIPPRIAVHYTPRNKGNTLKTGIWKLYNINNIIIISVRNAHRRRVFMRSRVAPHTSSAGSVCRYHRRRRLSRHVVVVYTFYTRLTYAIRERTT